MKTSLLVVSGLFYYSFVPAQDNKPSLSTLPVITIRLEQEPLPEPGANSLFSHFEVIDQRPDTARIGVHTNKAAVIHARDRQLVLPQPAAAEIAGWLNQHFARPGAPYTALIVLRTLWLSDASYQHEDLVKDPRRPQQRTHIRLKAEIYAGRDNSYIPVFRFDTLFYTVKTVYSVQSPYSDWSRNLSTLLEELADSASFIAGQKQGSARQIPIDAIRQFNQSRFESPIDSNTPLTQGVYASFEEFKNNAPSIRNFEIKMEGANRLLYIKESGGRSYYSHDAWGYCDGRDIFIMREGILRTAWREGKAYYFSSWLSDSLSSSTASVSDGAPGQTGRNSGYHSRSIYTIDMDTGLIY
jgi:hypothetical protein